MNWLIDAFWARIGWALGEAALGLAVVAAFVILVAAISAPRLLRQSRCKHVHFRETGSCDAVCNDCGKNLGFIGSWRDRLASPQRRRA